MSGAQTTRSDRNGLLRAGDLAERAYQAFMNHSERCGICRGADESPDLCPTGWLLLEKWDRAEELFFRQILN
jgi:hypothetical protein